MRAKPTRETGDGRKSDANRLTLLSPPLIPSQSTKGQSSFWEVTTSRDGQGQEAGNLGTWPSSGVVKDRERRR